MQTLNKNLMIRVLMIRVMSLCWTAILITPVVGLAQATFTAQLRGTVLDTSKSSVPRAAILVTNEATQASERTTADEQGRYVFNNLRPAKYTVKVEAQGFKAAVLANVVLRVGQQTDLDFTLEVGEVTNTVEITEAAPLLNSVSAALGQEVDNRYVTEVPLLDRQILNLAFLAPGVTEVGGGLFGNSAQISGVNFVSNGQRTSTTEVRLDGGLVTGPETGAGGVNTVSYQPPIEVVQEFKVQNNSFSAEYGGNGGTVISIVTKSGTNQFHGSGYWFGRRPQLDANNFFANRDGAEKADFKRDQYGGSVGGPIFRQKTFFFFDVEKIRDASPGTITTTVPTDLQRQGDFSQTLNPDGTLQQIFNPFDTYTDAQGNARRRPFAKNIVPSGLISPLAQNLMSYYPDPTGAGDPITGLNNFTKSFTISNPAYSYDIKMDQIFSEKSRLSGRYSRYYGESGGAKFFGNPADPNPNGGLGSNSLHNFVLEHNWTLNPTAIWTNRFGVERQYSPRRTPEFDPTAAGFPPVLKEVNGRGTFPRIDVESYSSLGQFGWTDTTSARTQFIVASSLSKVIGPHNLKFGGEQITSFVNFWQPGYPSGNFSFGRTTTMEQIFNPDPGQGNGLASLLLDFGDANAWNGINIQPGTANKSKQTGFFIQDDWRVTQRLTLNVGLRYEWSTPFTERFDRTGISDFSADTGTNLPGLGQLRGVEQFVSPDHRTVDTDRNNFGPRLGFAYRLGQNTVVRGGAGVYYGISIAQNNWYTHPAFRKFARWYASLDGGITRSATLENPFPNGNFEPQGTKYGKLNMWGFEANNDWSLSSDRFVNPETYQWNLSVQHQFTGTLLLEAAYSASRGTHLPFDGTNNRNFVGRNEREKWGTAGLYDLVPNPFQAMFTGPRAVFNEPDSVYNNSMIPRINLLRPYPQFDGAFGGNLLLNANSDYHALQIRIEKHLSHGLNFVGSYAFSKLIDDSSAGMGSWLGNSTGVQDHTNLKAERSLGGSDTPQRVVFGWSYELPVGKGKSVGAQWSKPVQAILGGWQINGFLTYQSGNPLPLYMAFAQLADGRQRPNLSGNIRGADIQTVVDGRGIRFNPSAFSDPGDQQAGNAPRVTGEVRGDSIHNLDLSVFKNITFRETMKLQLRAEFFNCTNTPRFGFPDTSFGGPTFGTINSQINNARRAQMGVRFLF